ncbi:MAG: PKD domain-containing protein [Crocinitomicaceae bacterium]
MQPICTQVGANFPASINTTSEAGNNYGCLGSQPNPAWYYLEVATNGNIDMNLVAPSDIDFIIWGPFPNLAAAQANCGSLGGNVDCSYSATNNEFPSIPGAVAGQVYIMLITNYANVNQNVTLTQTGGTGSTNCNIVYPCAISNFTANIGPCISPGNTYNVTGQITYTSAPSSGYLIVQDCNGTQTVVASAPFASSAVLNYTVNGMSANGVPCSLTTFFSADPGCTNGPINYTAPNPCNPCSITSITRNPSNCLAGNTYNVTGQVAYANAPTSGTLTVSNSCGGSQVFNYPFPASPVSYSINGLAANGAACAVTASFSATPCTLSGGYTAPALPNANAGAPQALNCTVTSVGLSGSSSTGGATFNWSGPGIVSGGATATPTVNAIGSYTVTVTNPANSCTSTANVNVTQNITPPNANAGAAQVLTCTNPTRVLTGSSSTGGVSFSWTGPGIVSGGATATPTVNAAGTYTLTVTNPANGCTATSTVNVTQNITPPNANAGAAQVLTCTNPTRVLTGSSSTGGVTFSWAGPGVVSGGATATPTVNAAGTYTLTVTNPVNGCTATATVNVTQNITPPNANAGATQNLTCAITSVVLGGSSSTGGVTFSWAGPGIVSGGATATPTVNLPGTYTLTVTNPTNGCTSTATVNVTQNITPPNANAGTPQLLTCTTTSVVLNGSSSTGGVTFSWAGPGIVSGGTTATPTVNLLGTYTLTVTNPVNGCTATSTVNVTQNITPPNVNAGAPQVLSCAVTSINLNGSSSTGGVTFSWAGPGIVSGGTTATPTVNVAGTYTLTVTNPANGCTANSNTTVTNDVGIPNANAGTPQVLTCTTTSVALNGSSSTAGVTFSWAGPGIVSGGATAAPTVNQPGTYTLTVTNPANGCTATATVNVTQSITPPNANAGTAQILNCTVTSVVLNGSTATGGATFSWAGPGIVSGGATATPTVNQPGTYTLTVTDPANGCTSTATVNVTQNITPPNANAGTPQILNCTVTSVALNGSSSTGGVTFAWAGPGIVSGGTTATPTVNQPGTYTQTVTDPANGCTATSTVNVTQNITPPNANAGAAQVLSCAVTSINLNGSSSTAGTTFSWAGPGIVSGGATATPTVNQAGTYILTVTNPVNGCTATSNTTVTNDLGLPNANAGAAQILNCTVTSVALNGSSSTAGTTFSWAGPGIVSGGSSAMPTVNQPGAYTMTVTDPSNGCVSTSNVNVTQNITPPNANAGNTQELTCTTTSVVLNGSSATGGATFSWAGPGIVSGGATAAPTVNQPGTYTLTVTDPANGCTSTATVNITQNIVSPNANAGTLQILNCTVTSVALNGSSLTAGASFAWAGPGIISGATTATPTVNQPGTYTQTVTDPANGCTSTSTVNVTQNITPPNANAGAPQELTCTNPTRVLTGSSSTAGAAFSWAGPGIVLGGATATPTVNQAGTYVLTVTDLANGCTSTSNTTVTNAAAPDVNAGPTSILNCSVTSLALGGSSATAGVSFSWFGPGIVSGGATATPTIDQPGTYVLTVTNPANGCSSVSNVNITQDITIPYANAGISQEINCTYPTITVNGSSSTAGVNYAWAGPGIVSGGSSATPVVNQPGTYNLTVTNPVNGCINTSTVAITEDVVIPLNDFVADSLYGCGSVPVNFQETNGQVGMNYDWDFGNGSSSSAGSSVLHYFDQVGCYIISLTVTDPTNGCSNSVTYPSLICVIAQPVAAFSTYPSQLESIDGYLTTNNGSENATEYQWNFGDGSIGSNLTEPTHSYADNVGNYTIQLVASNQGLCFDTAYVIIDVMESLIFYVPNTFTPDGDSYNEYFKPVFYSGFDSYDFTMLIFNRWGEIVWESHNYDIGWNGTYAGNIIPDGVYTWKIEVKTSRNDERKAYVGHVNVLR